MIDFMKKCILVLSLLAGSVSLISAQGKFIKGQIEIDNQIFEVTFPDMFPTIVAWNITRNIHPIPLPKPGYIPLEIREGDMAVDTATERRIVYEVLSSKREQLRNSRGQLSSMMLITVRRGAQFTVAGNG